MRLPTRSEVFVIATVAVSMAAEVLREQAEVRLRLALRADAVARRVMAGGGLDE